MKLQNLPGLIGFLGIVFAQISWLVNFHLVREWFYPIIWWSYILFIDGIIYYLKGESLIINRTKDFLRMLPWSIAIWLIFEMYNIRLENWKYENVSLILWQRWIGYAIAFATVLPAIFETAEFLEAVGLFKNFPTDSRFLLRRLINTPKNQRIFLAIGILFIILPIVSPKYFFPLVWLSFIFLLEPILEEASLLKQGNLRKITILFTSGLICGILWEFWNHCAITKWSYHLPYFQWMKIFEMPLLGYLGFLPFAWECYAMYEFTRLSQKYSLSLKVVTTILLIIFYLSTFYLIDVYTVRTFSGG